MREEPRWAQWAAGVDFRPLHLLRRNALVSAMLKPTLIGSAAARTPWPAGRPRTKLRAGRTKRRVVRWQTSADLLPRHDAATAWRFARFWSHARSNRAVHAWACAFAHASDPDNNRRKYG